MSSHIIKFINGRIVRGSQLVSGDVLVDVDSGKIVDAQKRPYNGQRTIDLKGRILAPGFIDAQFNGAFGFDLSEMPASGAMSEFVEGLQGMNRRLVATGVTSYLATVISQESPVYHKILPYLAPLKAPRNPQEGAESLGAHCEGPFISIDQNGCHSEAVITGTGGSCSLEAMCNYYGASNLGVNSDSNRSTDARPPPVKMITLAPELPGAFETIKQLRESGLIVSVGHTDATYAQTARAIASGATMVTHMFNAMKSFHHRDPGPFGVVTAARDSEKRNLKMLAETRPYFGIIADGIHLHPVTVSLAHATYSDGLILVTDAVKFMGCSNGLYNWNNGQRVQKGGSRITLEGTDTIAGSGVALLECVNNFMNWTGSSIAESISKVTSTPAKMLGVADAKGSLDAGADADMVVLSEAPSPEGSVELRIDEVYKFGQLVFSRAGQSKL